MQIKKLIISILLLVFFTVTGKEHLYQMARLKETQNMTVENTEYRAAFFSEEQKEKSISSKCRQYINCVENDVSYYPVAESTVEKALTTTFENSWMNEREYGGKRGHEGVDIIPSKFERGLFPVVSMTDGVVTNLGWTDKGGFRAGITTDSGIYYYYAHLDSYSQIKKGDYIKAGQLIGFMGDTGYGPETTIGKFPVHLHVGIYLYEDGKEISVNPYFVLKFLENKKLKYTYS